MDLQSLARRVAGRVHKRMSCCTGRTLAAPEGTSRWLGCPLYQQGITNPASAGREPPSWTGRSLPSRCHGGAVKVSQIQSHHHPPAQGPLRRGPSSPDLTVPPVWEARLDSPGRAWGVSNCWDAPCAPQGCSLLTQDRAQMSPLRGPLPFSLHHPLNFLGSTCQHLPSRSVWVLSLRGHGPCLSVHCEVQTSADTWWSARRCMQVC